MRQPLKEFNHQTILVKGFPGDEKVSYRYGKEIWKNCKVCWADFSDYDIFNVSAMRKKINNPDSTIDHLWIPHNCFIQQYLPDSCKNPDSFYAIGHVEKYTRKNQTEDYCLVPVPLPEILDVAIQYFAARDLLNLIAYVQKIQKSKNFREESRLWKGRFQILNLISHFLKQYPSGTQTSQIIRYRIIELESQLQAIQDQINRKQKQEQKREKRQSKGFGFTGKVICM